MNSGVNFLRRADERFFLLFRNRFLYWVGTVSCKGKTLKFFDRYETGSVNNLGYILSVDSLNFAGLKAIS